MTKRISRRKALKLSAAATALPLVHIRCAGAAGKLSLALWDHWVPTGNGAMKKQGQAAEEAAPNEQGQAAKGPRKLKQAEEQQPSQEKTGAIGEPKAKGGGEQASPKAGAPKAPGKAKGCSAEQHAAGSC